MLELCYVARSIPYSGKFSHGANFRAFPGWVDYRENKNSESLNMRIYFVWSQHREGAKIKTTKISSGGNIGESAKILHQRKFPTILFCHEHPITGLAVGSKFILARLYIYLRLQLVTAYIH